MASRPWIETPVGNTSFDKEFTISFWVRLTEITKTGTLYGGSAGTDQEVSIYWEAGSHTLKFRFHTSDGSTEIECYAVFTAGEWSHVVGRWVEGVTLDLTVDGDACNTDVPDGSLIWPIWFGIGALFEGSGVASGFAAGSFDDLAVWDRALSDGDLEELYNLGQGTPAEDVDPNMVFYTDMEGLANAIELQPGAVAKSDVVLTQTGHTGSGLDLKSGGYVTIGKPNASMSQQTWTMWYQLEGGCSDDPDKQGQILSMVGDPRPPTGQHRGA